MKKKNILNQKSRSEKTVQIIACVIMALWCAGIIFVYLYGVNAALRWNGREFMNDPNKPAILFKDAKGRYEPRFENFILAFKLLEDTSYSFFFMTFNSLWYALGGTMIALSAGACSTYVIAKYKNKFTRAVFNLNLFLMIFPVFGAGPALYKLYHTFGFAQTPLILLSNLNVLCNLMMYAFFSALPWTYAEAAFIDGATDFRVFFKIMLPMALPSISVIFVSSFIANWNDYSTPLLYLDRSFPTLASGLFTFENLMKYNANQPVYFAGVCMAMIPPIIIFSLMQNTIMSKVYFGGLKG